MVLGALDVSSYDTGMHSPMHALEALIMQALAEDNSLPSVSTSDVLSPEHGQGSVVQVESMLAEGSDHAVQRSAAPVKRHMMRERVPHGKKQYSEDERKAKRQQNQSQLTNQRPTQ